MGIPEDQLALIQDATVKAGMPTDVIIKTGERTVLDYIIKPLTDAMARSMTEQ